MTVPNNDFRLARNLYSDLAGGESAAHQHLSDTAFLSAIVEFEAALATAAGAVEVIETADKDEALRVIGSYDLDLVEISRASAEGGNPAIPIVRKLKADTDNQAGIHVGATSQDAVDTALMLCARRAGAELLAETADVEKLLADLARTHRNAPIMGRTLGQQALPTTFGVIVAGWLDGAVAAREALSTELAALPVQYAGATGNLVAVAPDGIALHDELAEVLGLANRPLVWHTNRQPVAALASAAARLAGAVRKIAGDIIAHSATEVGELREASPGGSSSMPHKANPAAAVACDGYARRTPGLAATLLDTLDSRGQRGVGSWHAEWQSLRDLLAATASSVTRLHASLDGITVNTAAMADKLPDGDNDPGHAGDIVDDILTNYERS